MRLARILVVTVAMIHLDPVRTHPYRQTKTRWISPRHDVLPGHTLCYVKMANRHDHNSNGEEVALQQEEQNRVLTQTQIV